MQDLLLCLRNVQEVGDLLRQPGRRFMGNGGGGGQDGSAAIAIQMAWRDMLAQRRGSR